MSTDTGTLYVAATPIGNLGDISDRLREVLRGVSAVACEDSRVTGRLLQHLGLKVRMISCRQQVQARCAGQLLSMLMRGESVALVTDAGTPAISDPGAAVVAQVHQAGLPVSPLPGPSALASALCVSGWSVPALFVGFLSPRAGRRKRALETYLTHPYQLVILESPHRIAALSAELAELVPEREVVLCRELTKMHEEVRRMRCSELAADIMTRERIRGEFTLVLGPGE